MLNISKKKFFSMLMKKNIFINIKFYLISVNLKFLNDKTTSLKLYSLIVSNLSYSNFNDKHLPTT